jgi:hypothetical protein
LSWLLHVRPWTRHECVVTLAWKNEKTIVHHLEQQLAVVQEIMIPQDDNDDRYVDAGSNPDAALTTQAVGLQNI